MQAIELNVVISDNHEIHLKLPDDVTATRAKVIVMYENSRENTKNKQWDDFFATESVFTDDFLSERDNAPAQEREFY